MSFIKGSEIYTINHTLRFDGGAAPTNPGPCAGAYVIFNDKSKVVAEGGVFFDHATNNFGEYNGLIYGLKKCVELGIKDIYIEGDSLLVISQISDKWKVRNDVMIILNSEVKELFSSMDNISAKHILRGLNSYADKLSDKTLSLKKSWEEC
jgi:ribonuclease HI